MQVPNASVLTASAGLSETAEVLGISVNQEIPSLGNPTLAL